MRWGGRAAMRSPAEIVDSEYIGVRIPSPPLNYFNKLSVVKDSLGIGFLQCLTIG
jgi:hypothetical protein